jgi:HEAT repeat protein
MSLYQLARDGATDELAAYLSKSDTAAVRARAAELLGDAADTDEDAVEALITAAADDSAPAVRGAAVDALDQLGQRPLEALVAELADVDPGGAADWAAAREYQEFLTADRPELRLAAATVLGRIGGEQAVSGLQKRFDDPDHRVRARAVRACGRIGARAVVPHLAEALGTDDSPQVRREAAEALGAIGDDRGVDALADALDDPNSDVRRAAVVALGELGDPSPVGDVVALLDDGDEAVRQATALALIDLLANAPADRSHDVRESLVDELGAVDEPAGVLDPMVDILESGAATSYRRNVVWLLGQIAGEDPPAGVVGALTDALCGSDEMVARFAATSLVSIGGETVETALGETLADDSIEDDARANAAFALGKVGGGRAREQLEAVVEETDSETVRQRAFAALSKVSDGDAVAESAGTTGDSTVDGV